MFAFFSVDTIAFTILGYPMSYIELSGTLLYLWSVWLIARQRILTWPVGMVSVVLYMLLFYQIRLYSDALEQGYYLAASAYGWWRWSVAAQATGMPLALRWSSARMIGMVLALMLVLSLALGTWVSQIHQVFPALFPQPAAFPYLDALTTIMSFTAMALMAYKRIESWVYWIVVDVIGIGLYYVQGVRFVSLLYVMLLFMATGGLIAWIRARQDLQAKHPPSAEPYPSQDG